MPFAFLSPAGRPSENLFRSTDFAAQRQFFSTRPSLWATPLRSLPSLAQTLGFGALEIKDETARFGLNAFKAAGTTFAVATLLERGAIHTGDTLVCASEGNHGRAVARAARDAGCVARIYMAHSVSAARVEAIQSEGAAVIAVSGTYDDAVRAMAHDASTNGWTVISDMSWAGYEEIPKLIMLGYTRLLDEAEADWAPGPPPHAIFVQGGVGGLLAAVACWADWRYGSKRPLVIGVEPVTAACLQVSARHGKPTTLKGPFDTVMGGLRCGEVSPCAFAAVKALVDAFVAIEDEWALQAIQLLAEPTGSDPSIQAGAAGAAALGGLLAALRDPGLADLRRLLALDRDSRVLVMVTEGTTDRDVFQQAPAGRSAIPKAP